MFMDFNGAFSSINDWKEDKCAFWDFNLNFGSIIDITKNVSSLLSLIASIVFNNSFKVKTMLVGHLTEIYEVGRVII